MKINWKELAKSKGYKSLKMNISDTAIFSNKKEDYKKFQWVINRAKHYANYTELSIETILDSWESKRSYSWVNYYQDCNQPRLDGKKRKL